MKTWDALYMSDFFIRNKRTLNTLCLFYDRVFLHDQFGVFGCVLDKETYELYQNCDDRVIQYLWDIGARLEEYTRDYLRKASNNTLDALVLKGVAQGLGSYIRFNPAFIIDFAARYADFLRQNHKLFVSDVLCFCYSTKNPAVPGNTLGVGILLDSKADDEANIAKARSDYKRACLFEQEYHKLPLVSDSEEDLVRWDREKDLLGTALAMAAIPSKVPTIADVNPEQILEARERLKDFLPAFRDTVLQGCWEIAGMARESSMDEVTLAAHLYYDTKIQPCIDDLEAKISRTNDSLLRRLLERGADKTALLAKCLDPTEPFSKWDLIASGMKSALDVDAAQQEKAQTKSPYEFLIRLPQALRR